MEGAHDDARRDAVDADVVADEFLGQGARQVVDEGLGTGVDAGPRAAAVVRRDGAGVDDVAVSLFAEVGHGSAARHDHRAGVEPHDGIEQVVGEIGGEGPVDEAAGVVDEDVEAAQPVDGFGDEPLDVGGLRNVGMEEFGGSAFGPDVGDDGFTGLLAGVVLDADDRTAMAERPGGGGADSGRGTAHQYLLPLEIIEVMHGSFSWSSVAGSRRRRSP